MYNHLQIKYSLHKQAWHITNIVNDLVCQEQVLPGSGKSVLTFIQKNFFSIQLLLQNIYSYKFLNRLPLDLLIFQTAILVSLK